MDQKNKILNHCEFVFTENGFYKTSMDEIASELNVSKKTIYKFFPTKTNLIEAVAKKITMNIKKSVEEIVAKDTNSVEKLLSFSWLIAERISKINIKWLRELQIHLPSIWVEIDNFRKKILEETMVEIIVQGKREGYIKDYPTEIILASILANIQAVINPKFIVNNNLSVKTAVDSVLDLVFSGMLTKEGHKIYKQSKNGS